MAFATSIPTFTLPSSIELIYVRCTLARSAKSSCESPCFSRAKRMALPKVNGTTQSCGCLREEFLTLGPMAAKTLGRRPQAVKITYPVPENLHHKPEVNEVMRRMMQYRWERVEFEARQIERGTWEESVHTPFIPRDDWGNRIEKLDLRSLAREKNARTRVKPAPNPAPKFVPSRTLRVHAPIDERDLYGASSLADRIRIVPA